MSSSDSQHTENAVSSPPHEGILRSSEALPWQGIVVEQRYHPAGEYLFPASSSLLICVHQSPPILLEQVRDGKHHTCMIPRGGLHIIPAGMESTWRNQVGADHFHLLLTPDLIQRVAADLNQKQSDILDHFALQDPRIEHIGLALLAEVAEGGSSGRLYAEGLATALAAHLLQAYSHTPRPPGENAKGLPAPLLRKIVSLIEDRLAEDLSLDDLANEIGLSPSHFATLFQQTTGLSPHRYLLQRRLERAQWLLRSTRLSIGEIAATVGFYDQSHLVRQMRRFFGITPKYLRDHTI